MRDYYILRGGRLRRQENTIYVESSDGEKKAIPVNDVQSLFVFGEVDVNTKLLVFLSQHGIPMHIFNYYGYYSGSYYPRERLLSGFLLVRQAEYYLNLDRRMKIAKEIAFTACDNILANLRYYLRQGRDVTRQIEGVEREKHLMESAGTISELMGCEGRSRESYYSSFESVLRPGFEFKERSRNPPENMVNCLISFGNSLLYGTVLSEIYHTQMSPTVSFLHEPGERRYSLALDLSEVFKPVIVDKVIFNLINNRIIKPEHFHEELKGCYLNDHGRRIFLKEYDEKLRTTIKHPRLGRSVSYQRLIRLECYKMVRHLLGETEYKGYRDR